jgi:hypothetical protein
MHEHTAPRPSPIPLPPPVRVRAYRQSEWCLHIPIFSRGV